MGYTLKLFVLFLQTLAEIGRKAQASQTHCDTTGSTSYAEKRGDFVIFSFSY